jgi:hypothetical protein
VHPLRYLLKPLKSPIIIGVALTVAAAKLPTVMAFDDSLAPTLSIPLLWMGIAKKTESNGTKAIAYGRNLLHRPPRRSLSSINDQPQADRNRPV